jgi:hypothetical protein
LLESGVREKPLDLFFGFILNGGRLDKISLVSS